ncbi:MAG: adenine phosphoribosyltransferase [Mycoplasmataceae bacterium]|jgi:adenine phosphoribosyltransferase|nr:adenine phosphoribosyltransferase [Mycoplasmataceae bacterium]
MKKLTQNQKLIISAIPNIPNFPTKGIQFKDMTPILAKPKVLSIVTNELVKIAKKYKFDYIVAPESRGFFFGIPLAEVLKKPFVPIRKKGKLPRPTITVTEQIEYSEVSLQIHKDDIKPGSRILIVDDLLATGGTLKAILKLIKLLKAKPVAILFVVELSDLNGRQLLNEYQLPLHAIVQLLGK